MDAHRKLIACIAVFVMLACMVPVAANSGSSDAAGPTNGVLLYEVSSANDKGVSLKNYSTATIDLKNYVISDGEGSITFSKSFNKIVSITIHCISNDFTSIIRGIDGVLPQGFNGNWIIGKFFEIPGITSISSST